MKTRNGGVGVRLMQGVFVVGGCVLAGLIGAVVLRFGYAHYLWNHSQRIFIKYFEKYGGKEK